jgi:hypothetical protein
LSNEHIDSFEELSSSKDEKERIHFLFLFDHVFGLDDEPLFKFRGVLLVGFGESVGKSFVMNAGDSIIFTIGIA